MLTETVGLDLANVGLGGLEEVSALNLFATVQARAIVAGTGRVLSDIENAEGAKLYPSFYRTRLVVPPPLALALHPVWSQIGIGVDVRRFGAMMLESRGALAPREMRLTAEDGAFAPGQISFEGSILFIRDDVTGPGLRAEAPAPGTVAELPAVTTRPTALEAQRRARSQGVLRPEGAALRGRFEDRIVVGRHVQPGRAMMFSGFVGLLELAETALLHERTWPGVPPSALAHRVLLEREVFYFGNVRQGETVATDLEVVASRPDAALAAAYDERIVPVVLEVRAEIHQLETRMLLATATARKAFVLTRQHAAEENALTRFLARAGGST